MSEQAKIAIMAVGWVGIALMALAVFRVIVAAILVGLRERREDQKMARELMQIRAAWEEEHSMGGKEPPPALTCMLLALQHIRKLKQENAQAYTELAKLTGKQPKPLATLRPGHGRDVTP